MVVCLEKGVEKTKSNCLQWLPTGVKVWTDGGKKSYFSFYNFSSFHCFISTGHMYYFCDLDFLHLFKPIPKHFPRISVHDRSGTWYENLYLQAQSHPMLLTLTDTLKRNQMSSQASSMAILKPRIRVKSPDITANSWELPDNPPGAPYSQPGSYKFLPAYLQSPIQCWYYLNQLVCTLYFD